MTAFVNILSHRAGLVLFSSLMIAFVGCGDSGNLTQVTGEVTVDGQPASGAVVLFHADDPVQPTASGVADDSGKFTLVSAQKPGIAPGEYTVTVAWPDPSHEPTKSEIMMGTAETGADLLKGKYASKERTTLSAEITPSTDTLPPFEL